MSRHKANTKSGWKKRDKQFRQEQHDRAKANRGRQVVRFLMTSIGVNPATPIDQRGRQAALKRQEERLAAEPTDGEAIEPMLDPSVQPFEGAVWDAEVGQWFEEVELDEVFETEAILADDDAMAALAEAEADVAAVGSESSREGQPAAPDQGPPSACAQAPSG